MKHKLIIIVIILILIVCIIGYVKLDFKLSDELSNEIMNEKILSNSSEFYDCEYNTEYITNVNEINLENKEIKNKYQFVYMADLQASIIDENEEDEQIRTSLEQRYNDFVSLNPKHIRTRRNI